MHLEKYEVHSFGQMGWEKFTPNTFWDQDNHYGRDGSTFNMNLTKVMIEFDSIVYSSFVTCYTQGAAFLGFWEFAILCNK